MTKGTLSDYANIYNEYGYLIMMGITVDLIKDQPDYDDSLIINGTTYLLSDFKFEPYEFIGFTTKIKHCNGWYVFY